MHRTNIYLDDDLSEQLDQLARQEGTSRAELVRRLLAQALAGTEHDLEVDLAAIESSFGIMSGAVLSGRGHDARREHLEQMWRAGE